jgi:hypothetical protein
MAMHVFVIEVFIFCFWFYWLCHPALCTLLRAGESRAVHPPFFETGAKTGERPKL